MATLIRIYLDGDGPYTIEEIAKKLGVTRSAVDFALSCKRRCAGHIVSRTKVSAVTNEDKRSKYKIYVDGQGPVSQYRAAILSNSSVASVKIAVDGNHILNGHYLSMSANCPLGFPNGLENEPKTREGRHVIIDGIEYKSAHGAAREIGASWAGLHSALGMKNTFKGHSIKWADDTESGN